MRRLLIGALLAFSVVINVVADAEDTPSKPQAPVTDNKDSIRKSGSAQPKVSSTFTHDAYAPVPAPPVPPIIVSVVSDESESWEFFHHKLKITETLLVIFTFALFIATWLLWRATQKLVKGAENTAQRQLRAYISVDPIVDPNQNKKEQPAFPLKIRNAGQTPAYQCWNWTGSDLFDYPLKEDLPPPADHSDKVLTVLNSGDDQLILKAYPVLGDKDKEAILVGTKAVFLWGEVSYVDTFGIPHRTRYAYVLNKGGLAMGGRLAKYTALNEAD